MTQDDSFIQVAREGTTGFIRITGKGSFKNAKLLKSFADTTRQEGVTRFLIDLQDCKHMDSTFMGVLAGLASDQKKAGLEMPQCFNLSVRNRELLETLGLDRVLNLAQAADQSTFKDYIALNEQGEPDKRETALTMLEAHQQLIEADSRNASKFQDVVKFLRHRVDS
ncbi:MAG: STAS domain-containing protein [Candidatus Methylacidiphilales bacterium]